MVEEVLLVEVTVAASTQAGEEKQRVARGSRAAAAVAGLAG